MKTIAEHECCLATPMAFEGPNFSGFIGHSGGPADLPHGFCQMGDIGL